MKNLFLSLAFMLIGTLVFASTENSSNIDISKIESLINVNSLDLIGQTEVLFCNSTVNFDDGGSGAWGGSGSFQYSNPGCSWADIFDMFNMLFPGWDAILVNY